MTIRSSNTVYVPVNGPHKFSTEKFLHKPNYYHFRVLDKNGNLHSRGGVTVAFLPVEFLTDNDQQVPKGVAAVMGVGVCSPSDNYSRNTGRVKATGKAIQRLERIDDFRLPASYSYVFYSKQLAPLGLSSASCFEEAALLAQRALAPIWDRAHAENPREFDQFDPSNLVLVVRSKRKAE